MNAERPAPRGDFLGNVVDRALERASVIVPRPASLFEPVVPAPPLAGEDDGEDAVRSTDFPVRTDEGVRTALNGGLDTPALLAAPVSSPSHGRERPPNYMDRSERTDPPAARAPSTLARPLRDEHEPAIEREIASPQRIRRDTATAVANRALSARIACATDAENHLARASAQPNDTAPQWTPAAASVRASLLPDRAIAAGFTPMQSRARGNASSLASATAPPSVTISIGRVEVRASAATAPVTTPGKNAREPMRLAEYFARKERTR